MKKIKIFGERNTATNYLSSLLKLNYEVEELPGVVPRNIAFFQNILFGKEWLKDAYFIMTKNKNFGWKHSAPKVDLKGDSSISFVTLTKNPYSWLLSLYKRPYHIYGVDKLSFEEFLEYKFQALLRDGIGWRKITPIELWNLKNRAYLTLPTQVAIHLRVEDILEEPHREIEKIGQKFFIAKKQDRFINYDKSTKNDLKTTKDYQEYYLQQRWKADLSKEAIGIINSYLDKKLVKQYRYELL